AAHPFHFETTFQCGTAVDQDAGRRGLVQHEPVVSGWNPLCESPARPLSMISPLSRMARPLLYRRASRTERRSESNETTNEGEVMKRSSALAIFLGTALMAGAAGASAAQLGDIQAPRSSSEDIQAPRTGSEDIQAPRTGSEDIQAPRTSSQDIQAPRTNSEDI